MKEATSGPPFLGAYLSPNRFDADGYLSGYRSLFPFFMVD